MGINLQRTDFVRRSERLERFEKKIINGRWNEQESRSNSYYNAELTLRNKRKLALSRKKRLKNA